MANTTPGANSQCLQLTKQTMDAEPVPSAKVYQPSSDSQLPGQDVLRFTGAPERSVRSQPQLLHHILPGQDDSINST